METEKEFLERFNPSWLDALIKQAFQFVLLACEAMVLAAGFRYGDEELGIWQLRIAYWVLVGSFSFYVGTQSALVVSGLLNKGKPQSGWKLHRTVLLAVIAAMATVFLTRSLSDAVVESQKATPLEITPDVETPSWAFPVREDAPTTESKPLPAPHASATMMLGVSQCWP